MTDPTTPAGGLPLPGGVGDGTVGAVGDVARAGHAASQGNLDGAIQAGVSAGAGAAGAYVGGEIGAKAGRALANSPVGEAAGKGVKWVLLAAGASVLVFAFLIVSVLSGFAGIVGGAAASTCQPSGAVGGGATPLQDPTPEQVAGQIYAQIKGYGYGDFAAGVALASAYFESTLENKTIGDNWVSGAGMTGSRGIYQQFPNAVPPELAWSGKPDSGYGNDYGRYNDSNAWGDGGWAIRDPRMNVAQAANIFVYGMGAGTPNSGTGYWGLDSPLIPFRDKLKSNATPAQQEVWAVMHYVQGFNPGSSANLAWAQSSYSGGIQYLKDIQAGTIPVPPFVPPMDFLQSRADSPETKAKFAGSARPVTPTSPSRDAITGTVRPGLLLIGDSIAEGVAKGSGVFPTQYAGGPTITRTQVGITTAEAITKWKKDIQQAPGAILVSLGANNYGDSNDTFGRQVDELMKLAGPNRIVYWYTMHYPKSAHFNTVLTSKAGQYPNLRLVDVQTLLRPGSGYTSASDGHLHPNTDGYAAMWTAAEAAIGAGGGGIVVGAGDCVAGVDGAPIAVNPGSSPLPGPDKVAPAYGWTLNLPNGRNMTYYSQADPRWNSPNSAYNFAMCGCGTTSAAMIIATLANKPDYTPLQAAVEQNKLGGVTGGYPSGCGSFHDPTARMFAQHGLQYKRIPSVTAASWDEARATLRKGGLVMLSVRSPTAFYSGAGHFVVVRGVAADGKFLIADPNGMITGPTASISAGYTPSQITVNTGMTLALPPGQTF